MNTLKSTALAAAVIASTSGLVLVSSGTASAADTHDVRSVSGSCSRQSDYTYRLADFGNHYSEVRVKFDIDSNKKDRNWTVKVYRNGDLVRTVKKTTGGHGNTGIDLHFVADDDAKIRVYAKAGYGEKCDRTLRLDTAS